MAGQARILLPFAPGSGNICLAKSGTAKCIFRTPGFLADVFWHEIPNHARNIELGAFVVMPNHIHGILILNHPAPVGDNTDIVETRHAFSLPTDGAEISGKSGLIGDCNDEGEKTRHIETRHASSLRNAEPALGKTISQSRFQNQGKNTVSSIIGGYKAAVTKHARRLQLSFGWQARFHDHIIRNDAEYQKINDYIETNVQNWDKDRFCEP